jgi:hypothetical protein
MLPERCKPPTGNVLGSRPAMRVQSRNSVRNGRLVVAAGISSQSSLKMKHPDCHREIRQAVAPKGPFGALVMPRLISVSAAGVEMETQLLD